MERSYKIKRYKRIYRRSIASIVMQWLLILGALALLFFAGWKLYDPVTNFLSGEETPPEEQQQEETPEAPTEIPEETPAVTPEIPPVVEAPVETPAEQTEAEQPEKAPSEASEAVKTVYLSEATVLDSGAFTQALTAAKEEGADSVLLDLKSRDGWVIYPISYKADLDSFFTAKNTISLEETVQQIREAGLTPMASIYTFRDRRFQQSEVYAGILYKGTESFWLDNSPELGGKSWLNPYSQLARDYVKKLISDAAEAGFEEIVLRDFRFPVGESMHMMDFVYDNGQSKLDCLKEAAADFRAYAAEKNVKLWIEFPAEHLNGGDERPYGGSCGELLEDGSVLDLSNCGDDSAALADVIASIVVGKADDAELAGMCANEAQRDALQAAGIDRCFVVK